MGAFSLIVVINLLNSFRSQMGRFDISLLKYMTSEQFRVLTAVELGMRNHELIPHRLVAVIANLRHGGAHKVLRELAKNRLVAYETWRNVQGYRLTNLGYDFLALRSLASRGSLTSVGNQIGVGKESDIYLALDANGDECVIKFHRLGRTSFRKVKEKRDYQKNGRKVNWIYLSRLAAIKEFAFMSALSKHEFPVPKPIDTCRHVVVMGLCPGYVLNQIYELADPARVFTELMNILIRLASVGLIHGDFNEFNVMLSEDYQLSVIDFPQMISTSHINAETLFSRDKECVLTFFKRRFDFEPDDSLPNLAEIEKMSSLDEDVKARGFTAEIEVDCNQFILSNQKSESDSESEEESESDEPEGNTEENDQKLAAVKEKASEDESADKVDKPDCKKSGSNKKAGTKKSEAKSKKDKCDFPEAELIPLSNEQIDLENELEQNYERMYPKAGGASVELNNEVGQDLMSRLRLDSDRLSVGQNSTRSKASTAYVSTTIPPSVIKQRLQRQSAKQAKRDQCRRAVKHGEASLKTKKKFETNDDIKTSVSAVWF